MDLGADVIEAARQLAANAKLDIAFMVGDAEQCDLPSGTFDVITSTSGIMFSSHAEAVAAELARLCRPGGRIGLTTWTPTSVIAQMFQIMRPYMPPTPTPSPPSPFEWGRQDRVQELLRRDFDLKFELGTTVFRVASGEVAWELFKEGYGPTKTLYRNTDRQEALRSDFIQFHEPYRTEMGISMPREYFVVIGMRR